MVMASNSQPRTEDMKAAAELVFALEEDRDPNDHMEIEHIYSSERNEEVSVPAGSDTRDSYRRRNRYAKRESFDS